MKRFSDLIFFIHDLGPIRTFKAVKVLELDVMVLDKSWIVNAD